MKRPISIAISAMAVILALAVSVFAAPHRQEQRPVIAQPEQDATVRGVVQLVGTATHPQFQRFELYYAPWPVPADRSWIFIGPDAHFQQQPLGLLGNWDSRAVPDGTYALRVRVVKQDGNYIDSEPRRVRAANTGPAGTPTTDPSKATPTPLPPPTVPPLAATAPVVVALPTIGTRSPAATTMKATVTPTRAAGASVLDPESTAGSGLGRIIDGERLLTTMQQAAFYTLAAFFVVGLFFGVKAVLLWLWQRIRP